jgi:hypothetical protein
MSKVTVSSNVSSISAPEKVSDVLKWILLAVAIAGAILMTNDAIVAGKAGFQKADLMG